MAPPQDSTAITQLRERLEQAKQDVAAHRITRNYRAKLILRVEDAMEAIWKELDAGNRENWKREQYKTVLVDQEGHETIAVMDHWQIINPSPQPVVKMPLRFRLSPFALKERLLFFFIREDGELVTRPLFTDKQDRIVSTTVDLSVLTNAQLQSLLKWYRDEFPSKSPDPFLQEP